MTKTLIELSLLMMIRFIIIVCENAQTKLTWSAVLFFIAKQQSSFISAK